MNVAHGDLHRLRRDLLDVRRGLAVDLARGLVGDQAHRDLGVGLGGDHGLGALAGEAGPDAVDVQRGSHPDPLERRIAGLAE